MSSKKYFNSHDPMVGVQIIPEPLHTKNKDERKPKVFFGKCISNKKMWTFCEVNERLRVPNRNPKMKGSLYT